MPVTNLAFSSALFFAYSIVPTRNDVYIALWPALAVSMFVMVNLILLYIPRYEVQTLHFSSYMGGSRSISAACYRINNFRLTDCLTCFAPPAVNSCVTIQHYGYRDAVPEWRHPLSWLSIL
jgi:hypothetical protein